MELKTARLTLLIDPNKKDAFERLCAKQDLTASQVVRQLIRDYLAAHGVDFVASGLSDDRGVSGDPPNPSRLPSPKRVAPTAKPPRRGAAGRRP
jgi:hypothetical protein